MSSRSWSGPAHGRRARPALHLDLVGNSCRPGVGADRVMILRGCVGRLAEGGRGWLGLSPVIWLLLRARFGLYVFSRGRTASSRGMSRAGPEVAREHPAAWQVDLVFLPVPRAVGSSARFRCSSRSSSVSRRWLRESACSLSIALLLAAGVPSSSTRHRDVVRVRFLALFIGLTVLVAALGAVRARRS